MPYKPNYSEKELKKHDRCAQLALNIEEGSQRQVAEQWLIARKINVSVKGYKNVAEILKHFGFTSIKDYDDLFYDVQPPEGWSKETKGYWTEIRNTKGELKIQQFFKGAFYDRKAHVDFYL